MKLHEWISTFEGQANNFNFFISISGRLQTVSKGYKPNAMLAMAVMAVMATMAVAVAAPVDSSHEINQDSKNEEVSHWTPPQPDPQPTNNELELRNQDSADELISTNVLTS